MVTWQVRLGDVRAQLQALPDASVQCCVTSPPYWGLRDYGVPDQLGLEPTPEHYVANMVTVFREVRRVLRDDGTLWLNLGSSYASGDTAASLSRRGERARACGSDGIALPDSSVPDSVCSDLCDECSTVLLSQSTERNGRPAERLQPPVSQTGRDTERADSAVRPLDASPLDARASTTRLSSPQRQAACSHCRNCGACLEVLRSSSRDASLCARMGWRTDGNVRRESDGRMMGTDALGTAWLNYTFKQKDLVPIPWMVAMALQADEWYLRSDIIWAKSNPMPESVTDRPTKAHEYIFLLTKSAKYYYDAAAIKEQGSGRIPGNRVPQKIDASRNDGGKAGIFAAQQLPQMDRNRRSVWTIPTQPYPEAHFATYPEALVEPCILAGTSAHGQCPACGAPWARVVDKELVNTDGWGAAKKDHHGPVQGMDAIARNGQGRAGDSITRTIGWQPTCTCAAGDPVPQVVLDPFTGSGTTGAVAVRLGRSFVGCELNPQYLELARRRIGAVAPLLAQECA